MFQAIRDRLEREEEGFTLIELLVVIIIIGILAAVAIPTFLNQRQKGWEAAAKSELRNAAIAQESYATSHQGQYTAAVADLETEGFNQSAPFLAANSGSFTITLTGTTVYCMAAVHGANPGVTWYLGSGTGEPSTTAC